MANTTTTARIKLALEGAGAVERGLASVDGRLDSVRGSLTKLAGGLSAATFAAWMKSAVDAADETSKLAQKTGLLTKEVAGLQLAFDQGGAGDKMEAAMARMSKAVVEGNKAFAAMGIEVTGAGGKLKSTREIFGEVSDRIASYQDGLSKTAIVQEIFGKSGADLLPVLNGGSAALDEYDKKAQALGLTLDEETTKAAEQFNDEMDIVLQRSQGVARQMASELLPMLTQLSAAMATGAQNTGSMSTAGAALATVLETIIVLGADVKYVLQQTGDTLGGLAAGYKEFFSGNLEGTREIGRQMRANGEAARAELDAFQWRILSARKISDSLKGAADFDEPRFRRAMTAGSDTAKSLAPIVEKAGAAAKKAKDEFAELYNKITAKDVGLDPSFYADLNTLYAGYQKGRIGVDEYRTAVENLVGTQRFAAEAAQALAKLQEEDAKANAAAVESRQAEAVSLQEQVAKERELIEVMGLTTSQVAALEAAKLEETAATKLRLAALADEIDWSGQMGEAYRQEAAQLQALAGLKRDSAAKQEGIDAAKEAAKAWEKTSDSIESMLSNALMRGFEDGKGFGESLGDSIVNMFKTYVAKEIAASLSKALLSSMSGEGGWLSAVVSLFGGGSTGGGGMNYGQLANAAYKYFTTGGTTTAAAGTISNGMTQAQMLSAQEAGMGGGASASGGSAAGTYMTYAAFIYAFAKIASNLYNKGYTRAALGHGNADQEFRPSGVGTTGAGSGTSFQYEHSGENYQRQVMDSLGIFSEKWRDILSGTTRMATLFGRKLKAFGLEAQINGMDTTVSAYERYKGGLFRSNKTIRTDATAQEVESLRAQVDNVRASSMAMARAMGYSDDAIESFTGSIRVNFKNAKTSEEAARRYAEAMEDLQRQMINAATGANMSKEAFREFMQGIEASIQEAGISTQGLADIITAGMMGRITASQAGDQMADMIMGGIYESIVSNYAGQIASVFTSQIITPIFTALAAGVPISQAISSTAIANIVQTAQQAAEALNAIFSNADFQAAMGQIEGAIGGVVGSIGRVRVPSFGSARTSAINEVARERAQLEMQLLQLQGDTVEIRRRELAAIKPANRAIQLQIWALEDQKKAAEEAAAAAEKLKDTWGGVMDSIADEMKRLRGEILGITDEGQSYALAQFAMATAAARAGDATAAERLPELARTVVDIAAETAASLSDLRSVQGSTLASLAETQRLISSAYGIDIPKFATGTNYVPHDMVALIHEGEAIVPKEYNPAAGGGQGIAVDLGAVVSELRQAVKELKVVSGAGVAQATALGRVERILDDVTSGGTVMRTREVAA